MSFVEEKCEEKCVLLYSIAGYAAVDNMDIWGIESEGKNNELGCIKEKKNREPRHKSHWALLSLSI